MVERLGESERIPGVLRLERPRATVLPLVLDSPHSGTDYPADFGYVVPRAAVRRAEDTYVDELFADAPAKGASLLAALFPRSYIDANRSLLDLDPDLLAEPWPEPVEPGEKARLGHGLIWRLCPPDLAMYDRKLTVAEVQGRIERFWKPYHATLRRLLDETHKRFGAVWHLNCHSMPSVSTPNSPEGAGVRRADIVLGDRDGTTCSRDFREAVRETLVGLGYKVKVNDPYKGVEIIRAYSDPAARRHGLQIEINRALYMNEATFEKTAGFEGLKADLERLVEAIGDYVASRIDGAKAAE